MFTPQMPDNGITEDKAKAVIHEMDKNGDGTIDKAEFVNYVEAKQKLAILSMEDSMEDMRTLYIEQIASQTEGGEASQTLNNAQLKALIIKTGHTKVTVEEVARLFKEMDSNDNGEIDIDEFMAFMYMADKVKTNDARTKDTVFHIRKASLGLNKLDVMKMFSDMPMSFNPSFSQKEMEKRIKHKPSSSLLPEFETNTMQYKDVAKIGNL